MPADRNAPRPAPEVLNLMHRIGYMHESEIEDASNTTHRSRCRWKSPRSVMFGNEKYFSIDEIKRHLDARAETYGKEPPVIL